MERVPAGIILVGGWVSQFNISGSNLFFELGDIFFHFGDLFDFWWVTKKGLRLMVLDQLYAETREIGYQYDKSQDGSLTRADANLIALRAA